MTTSTTVRLTCPRCRKLTRVDPSNVVLVRTSATSRTHVRWSHCEGVVRERISLQLASVLVEAGCRVERLTVPAEALEPRCGDVIGVDDVLDLMLALEAEDHSKLSPN